MSYQLFLIPILAAVIAQALKLAFDGIKGNFDARNFLSEYGGMPSSHTAFVVSLATIVALKDGLTSAAFAISLVLALIIIRDAIGFRRTLGKQSKMLNFILHEITDEKKRKTLPRLHEEIGHNPLEVLVGGLVGLSIALLANTLL